MERGELRYFPQLEKKENRGIPVEIYEGILKRNRKKNKRTISVGYIFIKRIKDIYTNALYQAHSLKCSDYVFGLKELKLPFHKNQILNPANTVSS